MKFLTLSTAFCFVVNLLFSQSQYMNPQPSGFHNKKIVFTDPQTGYILNYNGDLIKTTDQGETWKIDRTFYQAAAFDAKDSIIVVAGSTGLFVSSNNGDTWQKSTFTSFADFKDVDIVSADTIFMISSANFYKSVDRGKSWEVIYMGGIIMSCFDFIDSKIGFIGRTNTSMLKTLDGGVTWQQMLNQSTSSSYFYAVKFLNRDTVYAWRNNESLYKSTDRGLTWSTYRITSRVMGMSFPSSTDGYLVGESGRVWITRDAGETWDADYYPERGFNRMLTSVHFITPAIGFTVGFDGQISKTIDGGVTWKRNAMDLNDIKAMSFPNKNVGFVSTRTNAFKTMDRGKSWSLLNGPWQTDINNSSFVQAHFFSPDSGFFITNNPARLFKTNNGGTTWQTIKFFANQYGREFEQIPTVKAFNDSTFIILLYDMNRGHAIYKSKDRGETWNKIDSTKSDGIIISNVFFLDEQTAFTSRGYQLWKTSDGAKTWATQGQSGTIIEKVYFLNEKEGFSMNNEGTRRTADSGKTWTFLEVNGSYYGSRPTSMLFKDENVGFFTTSQGSIMKTIDRGGSWQLFDKIASVGNILVKVEENEFYAGSVSGGIVALPTDTSWGTVSVCHGGSFTFVADSGSQYDVYQWQVNKDSVFTNITDDGIYAGTNSYKLTIHDVPATWTNYQYRCNISSGYSKLYTFRFNAMWTGSVDNNWENPGNWSCGVVPDNNTDVTIASGTVSINQSTTIRSLQINPAVSINVSPGVLLNILQ